MKVKVIALKDINNNTREGDVFEIEKNMLKPALKSKLVKKFKKKTK